MLAATTLALGTGIYLYRNYSKMNLAENGDINGIRSMHRTNFIKISVDEALTEGARDEGHGDTDQCVRKPTVEEIKTFEIKRQPGLTDIHSEISGSPAESESEEFEREIEFSLSETVELPKEPTPRVDMRFGFVRKPAHIRELLHAAGNRRKQCTLRKP